MYFDYYIMEKLAKIDYDNQKNLRFFVNQYKKAQEMIKETEAFYQSFLISKTNTTLDVLNNDNIKWLEYYTKLNKPIMEECGYFNEHAKLYSSKNIEDFLISKKEKYDEYRKNGNFDGASIVIFSPLVNAVVSSIDSIKSTYNNLIKELTVYAVSCGKHPYKIINYRKDSFTDIISYYFVDKYDYAFIHKYNEDDDKIKPIFKKLYNLTISYDFINRISEYDDNMLRYMSYDSVLGDIDAFYTKEERKIVDKNFWSKESKELQIKAENNRDECLAWMLTKVRTEYDFKKYYPLVYKYYSTKYEKKLKEVNQFKEKFKFLFDNKIFERFNKLKKACIDNVLLKDFLKPNTEYIPFQGYDFYIGTIGWNIGDNYKDYQNIKIEDGKLETALELIKKNKIPSNARPGTWNSTVIPNNLVIFKTSENPKNKFSDYSEKSYRGSARENNDWLIDAVDKKKLFKHIEDSWKELIDMCKHIIISSADEKGNLYYNIPVKSAHFSYVLSNLNSRVIIEKNYDTVYYIGSSEHDLLKYKIHYDEKKDQVVCSRTSVEEHKKYAWPSDAPIIRTIYETNVIFDCSTGDLIKIDGSSDSDEISCKRRY